MKLHRFLTAAAGVAFAASSVFAQSKPTVAIMYFNDDAIGKAHDELAPLSKGICDVLITEMADNPGITVIERDQLQSILAEQKLVTDKAVDQSTAIKVGKLLSVHHMIFGVFMTDPRGNFRIDARAVDVESGLIEHVERVDDKADNIMTGIGTLSSKLNRGMHLPTMGMTAPTPKLPMRVAVMYGKALDMIDHGEKGKALELFNAVLTEFPDYQPANAEKAKLKGT